MIHRRFAFLFHSLLVELQLVLLYCLYYLFFVNLLQDPRIAGCLRPIIDQSQPSTHRNTTEKIHTPGLVNSNILGRGVVSRRDESVLNYFPSFSALLLVFFVNKLFFLICTMFGKGSHTGYDMINLPRFCMVGVNAR